LDVGRMSKDLGITSMEFLAKYTNIVVSSATGVPAVVLKMNQDDDKNCPFVREQGCAIYEVRPYSCRLYPLDTEQGIEFGFIVTSDKCRGLLQSREWTVESWRRDQGVHDYDDMDHNLKDVMHPDQIWGAKIHDPRMRDMILMVLYDPDRFREFIFESSFLEKFKVDEDILDRIREDDVALLYFGSQWLRFALFGNKGFLKIDRDYLQKKKRQVLASKGLRP
jgi:Fe-S-cluster containining protein